MAISTRSIANIGSPPDDPDLPLSATLYVPDPAVHPQPWHGVVGWTAARFQTSGGEIVQTMTDLANAGYLCLWADCRLMINTRPGQTTDGKYHHQTDDCKIGVAYMRSNPGGFGYQVTGKVAAVGGSSSAHHAMYVACSGTAGVDKSDCSICMSPVTDFSDRQSDTSNAFKTDVRAYGRTTSADTAPELAQLLAESPISLSLATASPIRHYNGTGENMPLSQLTLFNTAMVAAGGIGFSKYVPIINTDIPVRTFHSFNMWPYIVDGAIAWLGQTLGSPTSPLLSSSTGVVGQYQKHFIH